jgi:hypothetical protein
MRLNFDANIHVYVHHQAYVAWEDGEGTVPSENAAATWTPASCNTYVKINFEKWFR